MDAAVAVADHDRVVHAAGAIVAMCGQQLCRSPGEAVVVAGAHEDIARLPVAASVARFAVRQDAAGSGRDDAWDAAVEVGPFARAEQVSKGTDDRLTCCSE